MTTVSIFASKKNRTGTLSKSFKFRYGFQGVDRWEWLGTYPGLRLAEALADGQARRIKYKKWTRDGLDPKRQNEMTIEAKQKAERLNGEGNKTFAECAVIYRWRNRRRWTNWKNKAQWRTTLATYANPVIGDMPVRNISTKDIIEVLTPIWNKIPETADRVRGRVESVLALAGILGYRDVDIPNPARKRKHLDQLFASKETIQPTKGHHAIDGDDIPKFYQAVRSTQSMPVKVLAFVTAANLHLSEARLATWNEFDFEQDVWVVSASRHKARKNFVIPLTVELKNILNEARQLKYSGAYIFPGEKRNRPVSDSAVLSLAKEINDAETTVHGLRSSFRDWAADQTSMPDSLAELLLSHRAKDKVIRAYFRSSMMAKRRLALETWQAFCRGESFDSDFLSSKNVISIEAVRGTSPQSG
ncbi:MAG: tyrosine-type recombinase/integrase [Gammaproteobacteria bacterium]|nr:tyrosine-type recombinase/integrase [Gammaproteobacteria bacterium]